MESLTLRELQRPEKLERILAHKDRLAIYDHLQEYGSLTVSNLYFLTLLEKSVIRNHLIILIRAKLIKESTYQGQITYEA